MSIQTPYSISSLFKLTALSCALTLAACGSGGGSGTAVDSVAPAFTTGSGGNIADDGTSTSSALNISNILLLDSNGNEVRTITSAGATAKVQVVDASGNPIPNALVTFNASGVVFGTSNAAVLTDGDGVASISVKPEGNGDTGSYPLSASVEYQGESATSNSYYYTLGATGGGSTPVTTDPLNISAITLKNSDGNLTQVVTKRGATATVRVIDANGDPVSGALVSFNGEGVTFGTSNGSVITNTNGEATISLMPTNPDDTGSYTLSATAQFGDDSATSGTYYYSLQAVTAQLANLKIANASLGSGESTLVTVTTLDASTGTAANNVEVTFSATCGSFDNATVTSSSQGNVDVTYSSIDSSGKLCEGAQTITANAGTNSNATSSAQLTVAPITANAIVYSTAGDVELGIKGSGSSNTGEIEFTVYANGVPASNQEVILELVKSPNDFSFIANGNRASSTLTTDASGKVKVALYPGYIPGPVEVKATLQSDTKISASSKNVSVATGRVTQDGFSLSSEKDVLNNNVDGDTTTIVARLVDRQGNAVPDGTVVSFVSEGGNVTPNCATIDGVCSVTLTTQNPRPSNQRVTVLAYVEGEKSYIDVDADNTYTPGVDKLTHNIGDFYRDDNENDKYDEGEFKYVRGDSGATCADSIFSQPNIPGTCNDQLDAVIRGQMVFGFSDDTPTIVPTYGWNMANIFLSQVYANGGIYNFQLFGNSEKTVPYLVEKSLSVSAIDNTKDNKLSCQAEFRQGVFPTPKKYNMLKPWTFGSIDNTQVSYGIYLKECAPGDEVKLTVDKTSVFSSIVN